jgi:ribonuclease HII
MARFDTQELYDFDRRAQGEGGCCVVGLDEAGRGPLAGPVVAAAVVLDLGDPIDGIFDSKQLSPVKRELLYGRITARAVAWSQAAASVEEIEEHNILQASLLAMQRALDGITAPWSLALVDGNRCIPSLATDRQRTVVAGDATSASIAAASIIAKVTRDRIMAAYNREYPGYEFSLHKGYGTALHRDRIKKLGLCRIHRRSFCVSLVAQTESDRGGTAVSASPEPRRESA